jgi:hypothetical protein
MDAPRPEPALGDLEASTLAEQNVLDGYTNVLKYDLGGAIRHAVKTQHGERAKYPNSGRFFRHQDHRLMMAMQFMLQL